jgi:hypothetical protein
MIKRLLKSIELMAHWLADRRAFHKTRRLQEARAKSFAVQLATTGALRRNV